MIPDRRAVAAERRLDLDEAGRRFTSEGAGDPFLASWLYRQHGTTTATTVEVGDVVDCLPGGHCYKVSAGIAGFVWATTGFGGSHSVTGARNLQTLPMGTRAWFVRRPGTPNYATIIAVEPHWSVHTANLPSDSAWPFARTGQRVDAAHRLPLDVAAAAAAGPVPVLNAEGADFSAGRPGDQTTSGEGGYLAETGVGLYVDPFQAFVRVDEATGLFVFYPDQLTRLAGHNFQFFTALEEAEQLEDAGELAGWTRRVVYPWETRGLWRWNQVTPGWSAAVVPRHGLAAGQGTTLKDPVAVANGSGDGPREPEAYAQLPAARGFAWEGYLGQGGREMTAVPAQLGWAYPAVPSAARTVVPTALAAPAVTTPGGLSAPSGRLVVNGASDPAAQPYAVPPNARAADAPDQPGVFQLQRTMTGAVHLASARRVVLAKRMSNPTPRPVVRPEDPAGDSAATNYRASGLYAGAAAHKVVADLPGVGGAVGAPYRACQLPDAIAYMFNWENLHPFVYHAEDWEVAEEGAAGSDAVNQRTPTYANLATIQFLPPPDPVQLEVDHRYGLANYYETEAAVCLLDDGSVVVYDGWGSEIRMGAGNVDVRCAGDFNVFAGRNINLYAGDDAVVKAHNSVDLTAANGDLRTKAEKNSHHLSGNSGCGGFLFECKATDPSYNFTGLAGEAVGSSGFNVIAEDSACLVRAQDITLRLAQTADDNKITLDAGTHDVRVRAGTFTSHLSTARVDLLPNAVVEFTADRVLFSQPVYGNSTGFFSGCLTTDQWLGAAVHVATGLGGLVDEYTGDLDVTAVDVADRVAYLTGAYRTAVSNENDEPPNAEDMEFTCRTPAQYRTTGWVYWESRWQRLAAGSGTTAASGLPVWSEPAVTGSVSGTVTRPHPGHAVWTGSGGYAYQLPVLVSPGVGWTAVDRDVNRAAYETPALNQATGTLSSLYVVSVPAG